MANDDGHAVGFLSPGAAISLLDEWLAEMQAITEQYGCSEACARLIMHSRHGRSSKHTREFELTLVMLDALPDPMKLAG
ncbi:MAG TPA: hypothetical protein VH593_08590 [Ktedonobacteraceae bacterium]|jgi:hypothetical protein